jgi:glycosyltransferase involved in cell wall biosynthesis
MPQTPQTTARTTAPFSVSVVIATFNRAAMLPHLLKCLTEQSLPHDEFELVLVDDGSKEPAREVIEKHPVPFSVRLIEQDNTGQAGARDRGVREATGNVVIVLDDDMELDSELLSNHLAWHKKGYRVVLGRIASARNIENMPLFERFHAKQLDKAAAAFRKGAQPRGVHLCTGNVSFRREDYLRVGGFDRSLKRSEDRELGIRLELEGAPFVFGYDAVSIHDSDHASRDVWLNRAFNYGVYDHQIYEKHHDVDIANPWRFFFQINPLSRPFMLLTVVLPSVGKHLSSIAWVTSEFCDQHGIRSGAIHGVTYVYGLEYFRGLRKQAGSLRHSVAGLVHCLKQRSTPSLPNKPPLSNAS